MKRLVLVLSCALVLVMALPAAAQEQRGAIEGVVKDANGGVLPGVVVEARSPKLVGAASTVTDEVGAFRLPGLPPGTYEVTATLSGFEVGRRPDLTLELGRILKMNITLRIAGVEESVTVRAEGGLIDVKQSASFANLRADFIDKLPKGRDFTSVVTVAPGANDEVKAAGISIDGASGAENRYVTDGVDTTDLRTGKAGKAMVTDVIDEVQVKSSGYNAEFGGATGGVINVITKTGSNLFRGDAGVYFSSRDLEGAERQTLRLGLDDDTVAEYITYRKDPFTRWEPTFTLGGPIVKDRLLFFASFVPQLQTGQRTVTFSNGQTATFNRKDRTFYSTNNVTAQVNPSVRLKAGVSINPYYRTGNFPKQDGTDNPAQDYSNLNNRMPNTTYSGSADLIVSPSFYVALRGGYFQNDNVDSNVPNVIRRQFSGSNAGFPEIPADLKHQSGYQNVPTNAMSTRDRMSRVSLNADATYYLRRAGSHTFKTGIQFDRIANDVVSGYQQPRIYFYWNRTYTTLNGERVRGQYGYYETWQMVTTGNIHTNSLGLFGQDAWAITPKLTVNAGVRTEMERVPSYVPGNPGIDFGFQDKLAPRVGFAYDARGDGRWKLYGSWGIFYDITKLEMPRGSFGGDKWISYMFALDSYRWDQIGGNGCINPLTADCRAAFPGQFIEQVDYRHPSNDPANPLVDPNLKPMKSQEFTFGMDHELNPTTSIGVRYVRKWLNRTIEDVGSIVPGVGEVFYIANPGEGIGAHVLGPDYPADPKPVRDYDSVEFRLRKRLAQRWQLNASYTWSRLYGNYSGLATSDELSTLPDGSRMGRSSPNVNRFYDVPYMLFDENGQPVYGPLGTDRPHYVKGQAQYDFPFGTIIGVNQMVASGTPVSRQAYVVSTTPVFYMGRMSDGRTPTLSQTDLFLRHDVKLRGRTLALSLNVLNLFDQKTAINIYNNEVRDTIGISDADFFRGFNVAQLIQEQDIRRDPRFLKPDLFQSRRGVRVNARFSF